MDIAAKLDAFCREYGRGSLLVRTSDCPESAAHDDAFDAVWRVDSLCDLANELARHDLLEEGLRPHPLTHAELVMARERIRLLQDELYAYGEALDLAERVRQNSFDHSVRPRDIAKIDRAIEDLHWHSGSFAQAFAASRRSARRLQEDGFPASFEDDLNTDVRWSARTLCQSACAISLLALLVRVSSTYGRSRRTDAPILVETGAFRPG